MRINIILPKYQQKDIVNEIERLANEQNVVFSYNKGLDLLTFGSFQFYLNANLFGFYATLFLKDLDSLKYILNIEIYFTKKGE